MVFNTRDRATATQTLVDTFGFKLSDRTRIMNFLRPDNVHHAIAYADAKNVSLNHIAFEMQDIDAVMRGMGRLKDAGCPTVWGPGRHGPGNNMFAYFVAPFGALNTPPKSSGSATIIASANPMTGNGRPIAAITGASPPATMKN